MSSDESEHLLNTDEYFNTSGRAIHSSIIQAILSEAQDNSTTSSINILWPILFCLPFWLIYNLNLFYPKEGGREGGGEVKEENNCEPAFNKSLVRASTSFKIHCKELYLILGRQTSGSRVKCGCKCVVQHSPTYFLGSERQSFLLGNH